VVSDDGSNVGTNHDSTVGSLAEHATHGGGHVDLGEIVFREGHGLGHIDLNWREYWWYADNDLAPASHRDGPGSVCYLQDMADIRNHRHHGLIGALIVEPGDCTPVDVRTGREKWVGVHAKIVDDAGDQVANEHVLIAQDGLRLFVAGNPDEPMRDVVPADDPEDAGQRGFNYRSALVNHRIRLRDRTPPTPIWNAKQHDALWLRLVCAADKPRNHSFTLHGQAWPFAPWQPNGPWIGSISGLSAASAYDIVMQAEHVGDHAYRSGVFRWAVEQGEWGILRVE
jgi:manganese oxidase